MDSHLCERTVVKPMGLATFRVGRNTWSHIRVTDLGLDHGRIKVPAALAPELKAGLELEDWTLSFPILPRAAVKAKVVWVGGQGVAGQEPLEAGLQFSELPDRYAVALAEYILCVTNEGIAPLDFDGMPA